MPRPRYPSDERRKRQRPHVKIHLSCRSHPTYAEVFADPESRGIVWGLWLLAVQYHAAQSGDKVTLGPGDLQWLTGRRDYRHGLVALRRVCHGLAYKVSERDRSVVVEVRNLQRKQGFGSALHNVAPRSSAASEEPKNQGTEEQTPAAESHASRAPIPEGNGGRKPQRKPKPLAAWALSSAELLRDLLAGVRGAPKRPDVRAWAKWIEKIPRDYAEATPAEVETGIRWALGPENHGQPFELEIRSARSLYDKWPRLVSAAKRRRGLDPIDPEALARRIRERRHA